MKFISDEEDIDDYKVVLNRIEPQLTRIIKGSYEIPQIDSRQAIRKKQKTDVIVAVMPQRVIVDFMVNDIPDNDNFDILVTAFQDPTFVFDRFDIPRQKLVREKTIVFPIKLLGEFSLYTDYIFNSYIALR